MTRLAFDLEDYVILVALCDKPLSTKKLEPYIKELSNLVMPRSTLSLRLRHMSRVGLVNCRFRQTKFYRTLFSYELTVEGKATCLKWSQALRAAVDRGLCVLGEKEETSNENG